MIYPENDNISYIDIESGDHGTVKIEELLTKYYHETELDETPISPMIAYSSIIEKRIFPKGNILIKDWNGWSKLSYISRRPIMDDDVFYIVGHIDEYVILESHTMLPTYTEECINNPTTGFHGEVIYDKTHKFIKSIEESDYIRYYGDRIYSVNGFTSITPRIFEFPNRDLQIYNLRTESNYFNLNNFYLF